MVCAATYRTGTAKCIVSRGTHTFLRTGVAWANDFGHSAEHVAGVLILPESQALSAAADQWGGLEGPRGLALASPVSVEVL